MRGTGQPNSGMAARGRGGSTGNGRGRARRGRRRGNPGKGRLPSGDKFMGPVASATMRRERDRAPEGSRERAVWEGCIRRRAGMPARDIAAEVGMSYSTMYRDLVAMHRKESGKIAHPGERDVGRGSYHVAAAGNAIIISRTGGIGKGKRGRPHKYSDAYFLESAILRRLTGINYRQMAGKARDGAGGSFDTPSFSTFHKRIRGLEIEEDGADGRLWIGRGDARYEVGMVAMDGAGLRAAPRPERMPPKDGSRQDGRKIAVAFDAAARKALLVEMRGASEGMGPAALARLFEGALESVERSPGMTLTEGAIAAYGGAVDAAEPCEIAERAGTELLAPAGIDSSADPAPGGPAKGARKGTAAAAAPRRQAGQNPAAPRSGGRRPAKGERPGEKRRPAGSRSAPAGPRRGRSRSSRA